MPIRLSADFSKETLQAKRGWKEVFQVMKVKDLHPGLLYPAKLSFRMEGRLLAKMEEAQVHTVPPHTTKRRTNLKTKNHQN